MIPMHVSSLQQRAQAIRLVCFDVDGTLTDGRLYFDGEGREMKSFHVQDGQGLRLLEDAGIPVAFITARPSQVAKARAEDLRISHVFIGVKDKAQCLRDLCQQLAIGLDQVAYMGDDLPDIPAMMISGLSCSPSNAHSSVLNSVNWIIPKASGDAAARVLCDLILTAQNKMPAAGQSTIGGA
jgi:3-deoxy-D-manno-octulosonate 8-phosphate phosphatase (KDO 8-P phosphatase)